MEKDKSIGVSNLIDFISDISEEKKFTLMMEVSLLKNDKWEFIYKEEIDSNLLYLDAYEKALVHIMQYMRIYLHDSTCEIRQPVNLNEGISIIIDGNEKRTYFLI